MFVSPRFIKLDRFKKYLPLIRQRFYAHAQLHAREATSKIMRPRKILVFFPLSLKTVCLLLGVKASVSPRRKIGFQTVNSTML